MFKISLRTKRDEIDSIHLQFIRTYFIYGLRIRTCLRTNRNRTTENREQRTK